MTTTIDFTADLQSSLVHGGGTDDSNIVLFRRESIIHDGRIVKVPVLSGNAVRGVLRRSGAWLLSDLLGWRDTPPSKTVVRIVSSGGALRQEAALPVETEAEARKLPHLGLFGGSWAGSIHPGSLVVRKVYPVCAETSSLTGVQSDLKAGRLLDLEQFTRHDSSPVEASEPDETGEPDETNQMIYQVETLSAGVTLAGGFELRPWATPHEHDWLHACLDTLVRSGGHFGGRSATGHGRLDLQPLVDTEAVQRARAEVTDNADRYREVFGAFG